MKTNTKRTFFSILLVCVIACVCGIMMQTVQKDRLRGEYELGGFKAYAAYEEAESDVIGETKFNVSSDGNYLLIMTHLKNTSLVYEIGYDFGGTYTVKAGDRASNNTYYTSVTTAGNTTYYADDLFDDANHGDAMIVWEISYDRSNAYYYSAYAKVGINSNGTVYSYKNERVDEGEGCSTAFFTVTISIDAESRGYGTIDVTEIEDVPYGAQVRTVGNTLIINGTTVTATPANDTTAYDYEFEMFLGQEATITEDTDIIVSFTRSTRLFDIVWLNDDGSELRTDRLAYGATPNYGSDPYSANQRIVEKVFKGWDKKVVSVVGNATYTATYEDGGSAELANPSSVAQGLFAPCYVNEGVTVLYEEGETGYSLYYNNERKAIYAGGGIAISNQLIQEAKTAGYNYLEVGIDGAEAWLTINALPTTGSYSGTNSAYCDMVTGNECVVIDLKNITTGVGYTQIANVNQNTIILQHAKFVNVPVTENENYASPWFSYDTFNTYYADSNGLGGFKWAQNE